MILSYIVMVHKILSCLFLFVILMCSIPEDCKDSVRTVRTQHHCGRGLFPRAVQRLSNRSRSCRKLEAREALLKH